jgi:hypothetical protein
MKCHVPEEYGLACLSFAEEMDKLVAELTASMLRLEQTSQASLEEIVRVPASGSSREERVPGREAFKDQNAARPGHPGLEHDELIRRLALAQEGEELRAADREQPWKEIAVEIHWPYGSGPAGLASLRNARQRLGQLRPDDPLWAEIAAWRQARKTRKT